MILMDQVERRTEFLRSYIEKVASKLKYQDYDEALSFIAKEKPQINHTHISTYKPNSFLIDSLKTKRERLKEQIALLTEEKSLQEKQFQVQKYGVTQPLKEENVHAYFSRMQVTLKEFKKVEYESATISSDYEYFWFKNEHTEQKLRVKEVHEPQRKGYYLCFQALNMQNEKVYLIIKFDSDSKITKWQNSLIYGRILQENKSKRYLFMNVDNKEDLDPIQKSHVASVNSPDESQIGFNPNNFSNYYANNNNKADSLNKSQIVTPNSNHQNTGNFYRQTYVPENPFAPKSRTNTSHSLLMGLEGLGNVRKHSTTISNLNMNNHRPAALNRIRGVTSYANNTYGSSNLRKSQVNFAVSHQIEEQDDSVVNLRPNGNDLMKTSSKNSFRKASEDITLRSKKPTQHEIKLEQFRSQKNLVDDVISQAQSHNHRNKNSKKIESQIDKKNELLERNRNLNKSAFIKKEEYRNWINDKEEIVSQNSSEFVKGKKNTSQSARFEEQEAFTLDHPNETEDSHINNLKIDEESEAKEISPTFPKKMKYSDGSNIRLLPVEANPRNQPHTLHSSKHQSEQNQEVAPLNFEQNSNQDHDNNPFHISLENEQELGEAAINMDSQPSDKEHAYHESNPSQDHDAEDLDTLLDELKKGLILTKCAEGGFWTREKELKLSQNDTILLVVDVKDKKKRKIPLSDIVSIEYGKYGKGIIKHNPNIEERKCLTISVQEGQEIKKLQFVGNNPQKLEVYTANLNYYVENFKNC